MWGLFKCLILVQPCTLTLCHCSLFSFRISLTGTCFSCPRENLHLLLTKMAHKYRDVFSLMPGNRLLLVPVLNGVTVIQEGVVVIHRVWIRVQVRVGLQATFRVGLRILRIRVRLRATKRPK